MINPRLTVKDIKRELNSPLSLSTIRRRLVEGGRFVIKPVRKPLLTAKAKLARFKWARQHRN